MPYVTYTPEEAAVNAAALTLRQWAHEQRPKPKTYGWADQFTYRHNNTLGTYSVARQMCPDLPLHFTDKQLQAWSVGLLGYRVKQDGQPPEFVPFGAWEQRPADEQSKADTVPALSELRQAWGALAVQPMLAGERGLLTHLGIEPSQRPNVTNALNGKRETLPAPIRVLLGGYLLP